MIQLSQKNVYDKNAHPNRKQKERGIRLRRMKKILKLIRFMNHPIKLKIKEPDFVYFFK